VKEAGMADRFFVKVFAAGKRQLLELQKFDVDLFQPTARATEAEAVIEGLLTMDEVERLVKAGYRVLVEEESSKRARARDVIELGHWLQERRKAR
jgi:hypothetical protein